MKSIENWIENQLRNINQVTVNKLLHASKHTVLGRYRNIDDQLLYELGLKDFDTPSTRKSYLIPHLKSANDSLFLSLLDKKTSILVVDEWFGLRTWLLKQYGFENVDSTSSLSHMSPDYPSVKKIRDILNVFPYEDTISREDVETHFPGLHINSEKKYDIILCIHYKGVYSYQDVLHYNMRGENNEGSIFCGDSVGNKVFYEKNEEDNTYDRGLWQFFTVWNSKNIIDFHNQIKKFLTPKGKAFINLYPFVYDRFEDKFEKENDIFNQLGGVKSISMDSSQPCPSYEKYYILKNDEIT